MSLVREKTWQMTSSNKVEWFRTKTPWSFCTPWIFCRNFCVLTVRLLEISLQYPKGKTAKLFHLAGKRPLNHYRSEFCSWSLVYTRNQFNSILETEQKKAHFNWVRQNGRQKEGKKTPGKHYSTENHTGGHTENQLIMLSYFQIWLHKGSFEEVQGKSPPPSPIFSL